MCTAMEMELAIHVDEFRMLRAILSTFCFCIIYILHRYFCIGYLKREFI